MLASATEVEDGNAPPWRPDDGYASDVLFDIISSRRALSGSGSDGQRFSDQQSIIHTDIGREEFEKGMTAFWRKIVAEPDAFPPEVWQLDPHRIRVKMPAALHGHDMQEAHHRRGDATVAAAVGGRQPRGEAVWGRRTRRSGACGSHG